MGSHIPIRQLRRSSVNARPCGATLRGLVVSAVFTNTWAISPSLCRFSVSKRSPGIRVQPWGLHPLSRDISSGFSDSLFFPSALFNSPVASGRTVSTFWKVRGVFQVALVALFVGMVLYLAWREWVDPGGSSLNFDLLGSRPLSSVGLSAYRLMFPQSTQLRESVEKPWLQTRVLAGSKNGMLSRACCSESARVTS